MRYKKFMRNKGEGTTLWLDENLALDECGLMDLGYVGSKFKW